jgi:hypothetical protein
LGGTRILTPGGPVAVETLAIGDAVVTRFTGIQALRWIGRRSFAGGAVLPDPALAPVRIAAGALGHLMPARDLFVAPAHGLLIDGQLIAACHLVNGRTVTQPAAAGGMVYVQLALAQHDCVLADGAWAETCLATAGLPLCAPRPPRGPRREAALRPVVERASAGVAPGTLEGFLDQIVEGARVEGWAWDKANPDLPVLLDIRLAGQVLGSVLACERRADLVQARKGRGHCSFSFLSPVPLGPEAWGALSVHRAADGVALPRSDTYREAAAALSPNHKTSLRLVA